MKLIKNFLFIAMAAYLGLLAYYIAFQRDYIYFPSSQYVGTKKAGVSADFEEIKVMTEDRLSLIGWYARAMGKPYTIVFFHGSGDSLQNAASIAMPYIQAGYGFFLAEYRGYSGMPGKPTENGLYADGRAFMSKLFDLGVDPDHIIVMGHSLGCAVGLQMVSEFQPAGLVMLAPFSSLVARAHELYPYFPTHLVVFDQYANDEKVGSITAPLLILHGDKDKTVPLSHGQKLYRLAHPPKNMQILEGFAHNDMVEESAPFVLRWLGAFGRT